MLSSAAVRVNKHAVRVSVATTDAACLPLTSCAGTALRARQTTTAFVEVTQEIPSVDLGSLHPAAETARAPSAMVMILVDVSSQI